METEFDDVYCILAPDDSVAACAFIVEKMPDGRFKLTLNGSKGYTIVTRSSMKALRFSGYKFIRSEKEFLGWYLKHGA